MGWIDRIRSKFDSGWGVVDVQIVQVWEYKVVKMHPNLNESDFNEFGADGWELVSLSENEKTQRYDSGGWNYYRAVFRRRCVRGRNGKA